MRYICKHCGKPFDAYPSGKRKYCSRRCFDQARIDSDSGRLTEEFTCEQCGKSFTAYPHESRRYCSQECYYKSLHKAKVEKTCIICGKKFECVPSREDKRKTCSRECMYVFVSRQNSGEKSVFWKGGIEKETYLYPAEFYKIRKDILDRDNYKCKICSSEGNNVHHIDRDENNNDPENLVTLCASCHGKVHFYNLI